MIAVILLIAGSSFAAGRFSGRRGKFMATANNSPETCPGLDVPGKVGVARRGGDENGRLAKPGQEITGTITKISGNDLTISSQDKTYTIVIDEDTSISKSGDIAKQSDLKEKDQISITGSSKSDGSITAQTIIIK